MPSKDFVPHYIRHGFGEIAVGRDNFMDGNVRPLFPFGMEVMNAKTVQGIFHQSAVEG